MLASVEMAALEFRVLGPLEVRRDGEVVAIPAPKQRALLGLLLLHANEPVAQEELIELLWGDFAPPTARASLQNQVHGIRRLLGGEVVERQAAGYVVHVESGRLDLERFEQLVAEARHAEPRERAAMLREALACWRGPALVEFPSAPFAHHEIGRLEEERLTALEGRVDADLRLGLHADTAAELEGLVERSPLRERLWAQLMLALYRSGRQADAVAAYRRAHRALADGLGIEPGVPLRELQRAILAQDPALDELDYQLGTTLERAAAIIPREAPEQARSLYEYGCALIELGESRQGAATLKAAERMAAATGERTLEERARLMLSHRAGYTEARSPLEHLAVAERAAGVFERLEDEDGLATALRHQAASLLFVGRCDDGALAAERAIVLAARVGNRWEESSSRAVLARCLADGTRHVEQALEQCEEHFERCTTPRSTRRVEYVLAVLLAEAGRFDDARRLAAGALDSARHDRELEGIYMGLERSAQIERSAGAHAAAELHWRTSYELLEVDEQPGLRSTVSAALACVLALRGDTLEAGRLAREARALTQSSDDFLTEVLWRSALALVNAREGRGEEAIRLADEAVARVTASDALLVRGRIFEDAATVQNLAGDRGEAKRMLHLALENYESKGSIAGAERVQLRLAAS